MKINERESLKIEFKSDKKCLPDNTIIETVVGLANTLGGILYLGVEDDGEVTGIHKNHNDVVLLTGLIFNKTNPSLQVDINIININGIEIGIVNVPDYDSIIMTSSGKALKRRIKADGTPELIPMKPEEIFSRATFLGKMDLSAQPIMKASMDDFDPIERKRLKDIIRRHRGEEALLKLPDDEIDGALSLFVETKKGRKPTYAGLLIIGKEESVKKYIPTHEACFQVLDGTKVKVNDIVKYPLLHLFEFISEKMEARNEENEVEVGLLRIPIPDYDKRAFRESFINAIVHRDYAILGSVQVQLDEYGLMISSPGGFIEGITINNILSTPPRSRNQLLADILKRIGLAERTGRGVDRIYKGMLRFGRPLPDYSSSNDISVCVIMMKTNADIEFMKLLFNEEKRKGRELSIDAIIILYKLMQERRLNLLDLISATQRTEIRTRSILEELVESGLVEAYGTGRGRSYTLSIHIYNKDNKKVEYIRQKGFDIIQQEQMILQFIKKNKSIKRNDATTLCRIGPYQATRLLKKMVNKNIIEMKGERKNAYYILKK